MIGDPRNAEVPPPAARPPPPAVGADAADVRSLLFDAMPDLGWTARPDGYIDYFNRRWYEFTGTTYDAAKGWGWESVYDPAELSHVVATWKESLASGAAFELESPIRREDGVYRWFLTRATPIRDSAGRLLCWVGVSTDVDDQRRALRTLADLRRQAESAVRSREELLAIVSHDLRNPLSVVLLGAEKIERLADGSEAGRRTKKAVETIRTAADRMSRLVRDLLDLARLEAGHSLVIDLGEVDVAELTRQTVLLITPLAEARNLALTSELPPSLLARCDGGRIEQVLSNLIVNAMKFTPEGGTIHVAARRAADEMAVSVTDTGIGIPGDRVPHIFSPYWQADTDRKRGAGLGLSIAKAIVDAHAGRIWVETIVGTGSTFHFTLPALDARATKAG